MNDWISFLVAAEGQEGIGLNTDIFETNIINIVILIALLFYVLGNFLGESLSSRQSLIAKNIQDAEQKLSDATKQLEEAKLQWSQLEMTVEEIWNSTQISKENLQNVALDSTLETGRQKFDTTIMMLKYRQQKSAEETLQRVSEEALDLVVKKLQDKLDENEQRLIIDSKISKINKL